MLTITKNVKSIKSMYRTTNIFYRQTFGRTIYKKFHEAYKHESDLNKYCKQSTQLLFYTNSKEHITRLNSFLDGVLFGRNDLIEKGATK